MAATQGRGMHIWSAMLIYLSSISQKRILIYLVLILEKNEELTFAYTPTRGFIRTVFRLND